MIHIQNCKNIQIFFPKFPVYVHVHITVEFASLHGNIANFALKLTITEKNWFCHIIFWPITLTKNKKILKSMLVMHRIRKERRPTNKKSKIYFPSFSYDVFVLFSFKGVFSILPYMYLISLFPCCSVFFLSMEGNIPWRQRCLCGNFPYVFFGSIQS